MAKKQMSDEKKRRYPAVKAASNAKNKTHNADKAPPRAVHEERAVITRNAGRISGQRVDLLPPDLVAGTIEGLKNLMNGFGSVSHNNLNALQRRRKIGAGIKNYGFIEKTADLAETNPQFTQFFSPADLRNCIRNFDMCREVVLFLQSFSRLASNTMLVYSSEAYNMSLIFYNMVKEMSKRGEPEAIELFKTMQPFFRKQRRSPGEPSKKKLMRDARALASGKKDGRIVVENISPVRTGGMRKIIDDVHGGSTVIGQTAQASEN